ncbi:MAG: hypothetical protein BJ554DRAFT_7231, partial [Olpidium bornovanus]
LACFAHANTTQALKDRFQLTLTEPQAAEFAETLIMKSCYNVFTRLYDVFQYQTNGGFRHLWIWASPRFPGEGGGKKVGRRFRVDR